MFCSWSGQGAVVDDGCHLAVVEGAQRRVVLERDLRNLVLGVDRHLEYVRSWKYPTLSISIYKHDVRLKFCRAMNIV